MPTARTLPYWWPLWPNLLLVVLLGWSFFPDPNLTAIVLFVGASTGLNLAGGLLALVLSNRPLAKRFGALGLLTLAVAGALIALLEHISPQALEQQ